VSKADRAPAAASAPAEAAAAWVLFTCPFEVRWSDVDGNRHVRNTAFSEYATHTRFRLLAAHGFDAARLEALRFGPVMMREETRYRRELHLGDQVTVTVRCSGLSADASHWRVQQEVLRDDGKEAAVLTIVGGWIHLDSRKLIVPPPELAAILLALPRTRDFEELATLIRGSR
jgi:acyl-CoA thioester hydrolase